MNRREAARARASGDTADSAEAQGSRRLLAAQVRTGQHSLHGETLAGRVRELREARSI